MTILHTIGKATALEAQQRILNCESCTQNAGLPVACLLDEVTGCEPGESNYALGEPLKCPRCASAITEGTFVGWE